MEFLKRQRKRWSNKKTKSNLVRDAGATESELTGCKGLWFRDKFVKSVSSARTPQSLQNVVSKFESELKRIVLPPPRVADIDQVRKDAQRDSMIINGKIFKQSDSDPLDYLAENIEQSRSPRRGDRDRESVSRSRRFARQILMTSSRTVSGSDSFFVCRTLFQREDFHLTPSVHNGVPTVINVDATGKLIRIKCTNTYKITTQNKDEDLHLTGISMLEWITLKTVIEQSFSLPVQTKGRLNAGERVMCIVIDSGEDETEELTLKEDDAKREENDVKHSSNIVEVRKIPTNEMKVLKVSCNNTTDVSLFNQEKKKEGDDDDEEDLLLLKLPPPPRKTSRRSTSRSPSRSPKRIENKKEYKVRFSLEGSLGLGYHWMKGIGPKIKALRPNSQADGRVRIGDIISHINGTICPKHEREFRKLLVERPLVIRFRKEDKGKCL